MQTEKLINQDLPKVYNSLNPSTHKYKHIGGKSMTIPDQSMTVRQILERYSRGMPIGNQFNSVYNGPDLPDIDFKRMDLAEVEDMIRENQQRVETLKKDFEEQKAQKHKEREDKRARELQDLSEKLEKFQQSQLFDQTKKPL